MPTPPPDPSGRPFSATNAPGSGNERQPHAGEPAAPTPSDGVSTDAHYPAPAPEAALSDLLRNSGSSRRNPSSDILQFLANPTSGSVNPPASAVPGVVNTDDAPTVITQNRALFPPVPQPLPLIATSDPGSLANRRLGHFELIEAIGAGGMAAVLKARDLELGRIVALKILPPESARDGESVTRFKQEARAAAMLDHDNVARVYYCGEDQGLHFIAFEFVEGDNLRVLIERRGTIPAVDCIRYMIQVAAGLNHAAERGVVHRDIKPSNIIITPDGRAKIVDMGLARHLDSLAVNGGVTQSGVTLGTFDYISPEQALDPRRADVRSDIYSLGCAFYHALTGRPPVPEGTAAKKLYAHQHIDPLDPRLLNPTIPDGLAVVLSGMMAKNPEQRFQTPTDLIAHLKGLMERLKLKTDAVVADSVVQAVPAHSSVLAEAPRLRMSWILAACSVAIAIAALAMTSGDSGPRPVSPAWATDVANRKEEQATSLPAVGSSNTGSLADDRTITVKTAKALIETLSNPNAKVQKVQLGSGDFKLTDLKDAIEVAGKEPLELVGAPNGSTRIVLPALPHGSLIFNAESLIIRGIRFEIRSDASGDGVEEGPSLALAIRSAGQVVLEDCYFSAPQAQAGPAPFEEETIAVGIFSGPDAPSPRVKIVRCAFAPTGFALQLPARSEVSVDDCGFAARKCAIQVVAGKDEGIENGPATTMVRLARSSFMLEPKSAVVETGSSTDVTAGYCVFAALGKTPETASASSYGCVLNIAKSDGAKCSFAGMFGQKNAYYRVNPLAFSTGNYQSLTFDECKAIKLPVEDKDAVTLAQRPWNETHPLAAFADKDPWAAFGLKIGTEPAVFVEESPKVIGVQFHNTAMQSRRAYPPRAVTLWPPVKPRPAELAQKVWFPLAKDNDTLPDGTSNDLISLLRSARPDDVIQIKHDGLLTLPETIELLKPRVGSTDLRLTFKPAPGYKPILTVPAQGENLKLDQSLFRLMNGDVSFEGIQFLLKPPLPRNPFKIAAVSVVGGKSCTFSDCVFTLAEDDERIAAVVMVEDPDKIMAMAEGASRPVPEITFKQCILRGKGRGVWVEVSRAVKVELTQTLTAIDGPLLLTESAGKPLIGVKSSLKLNRVTLFVGGPVLAMKGGKLGEMRATVLVPFDVHTEECLFAAVPGAGQPLVELDGIDPGEVNSILKWQVENPNHSANRYANFDDDAAMLVIRSGLDGATPKEWDWNQWMSFAREPLTAGKPLGKVMFAVAPTDLKALAAIKRDDVRITEIKFLDANEAKPDDAGANWKTLPNAWPRER